MDNICAWCGNEFPNPNKRKKYCCSRACTVKRNNQLQRWSHEKAKRDKQAAIDRKKALNALQLKARAAGMSYGQYIARTEGGMR